MAGVPERFDHDGHRVIVWVGQLEDDVTFTLNRYLSDSARETGRYDEGMAQYVAIVRSVEKLKIDEKVYNLRKGKGVPRYYDSSNDKTLLEHVLGYVIRHNPFLVEEERYSDAFEEYSLDATPEPMRDPTESPA